MKILYITYIDFGNMSSGSNVRPQKIYEAFINRGHEIKLISTQQNRYLERSKVALNAISWVKKNNFDACYVELPSGPIFNLIDIYLLKVISKKNKPIHVFYRDAYWLLAEDFFSKDIKNLVKIKLTEILQKRDLRVYNKTISMLYMPTETCIKEFSKYYKFKNMKPLPPGTDNNHHFEYKITHTGIYVGGSTKPYGVDILIKAYEILNKDIDTYKLIIVTRNGELQNEEELNNTYDWIIIVHKSGKKELEPLYRKADCAFLPQRKSLYLDMSFGIKMFEYIGYGLPIIVNDLFEMKRFVEDNGIGISYNKTAESLAESIKSFYSDGKQHDIRKNIIRTCNENLWVSRVDTIVSDFEYEIQK